MSLLPEMKVGTHRLRQLMRERYCAPEWALFEEVPAGTGWSARGGYADALAMNLYPSQGLEMNGFEIKVSRSDWQKEMRDHAKAELLFGFCDRWWLVVGDRSIVRDGELPEPWGLMATDAKGLRIIKKAPKLNPQPLSREFFAALARRAAEGAAQRLQAAVDAEVEKKTAALRTELHQARSDARPDLGSAVAVLQAKIQQFEEAAGFSIDGGWRGPEKLGQVVRALLENGVEGERVRIESAIRQLDNGKRVLEGTLKAFGQKGDS